MSQIIVHVGRTNTVEVKLMYDVSQDTITSQIREGKHSSSVLIAEWDVSYKTDGTDGALILKLDNSVSSGITARIGYMDLKRVTPSGPSGEPVPVFDDPIQVVFRNVVTV